METKLYKIGAWRFKQTELTYEQGLNLGLLYVRLMEKAGDMDDITFDKIRLYL